MRWRARPGRAGRLVALACLALSLACAAPRRAPRSAPPPPPPRAGDPPAKVTPVVHVLRPGETVYRVSRLYGVPVEAIVRENGIRDVSDLSIGTRLVIPGTNAGTSHASVAPGGDLADRAWREAELRFAWPLTGRFSSGYGRRGWRRHEGIDIATRPGTPVRAAEAGRVTHSGWLGDYGRVVIVKHAGHYSTVYAHNRKNRVRKGAFVEKGQVIAEVGASGNASGPHLHFEIRRQREPEDPMRYLPSAMPSTVPAPVAAGQ